MHDLIKFNARKVVSLLKKREISPLELIELSAERIRETDGIINALPTLCFERAREHARKMMSNPPTNPPASYLYGLPIAVKDLTDVARVRTTKGSLIFADYIPEHSDYLVETLERNGALIIAKSNTAEFGAGANTFNEIFGATHNPWDTRMTSGGSSGGAAAALATGQVWLATGSDLGGSVRIPASYCLGIQGPMGRTVEDVALMLDAQVGEYKGDPLSLPKPEISFIDAVDRPMRPERIGFTSDLGFVPVDHEVKQICTKAAVSFTELGSSVEEAYPDLHDAEEIWKILRAIFFTVRLSLLLEDHNNKLKPELIKEIKKGLALTGKEICWAQRAQANLYHRTVAFFQKYDLLITPTVLAPPFDINMRYLTEIEGVSFNSYVSWLVLTFAITLTSCPAISVPCGFTTGGLPIGLQIIGPPRGEEPLFGAAALFEEMHGLNKRIPINPCVKNVRGLNIV
jgi:amidase